MTNDFPFAMMSTKSKPTWRHSTWNGTDYMICTVAEPQKKLPVFRAGKWSLVTDSRVSRYGHDAKTMKSFTLYFDTNDQFGEMWFPVQKHAYHVHSSVTQDCILDPADLDLDEGHSEPDLCFSKSQVRDPAYALLDSGATHVLLPGHMLPKGARSFEVTVNFAVGKEKDKCWRNEVYAEDRAHPLLPLGRLANLLDTKFVWEDGTAVMQCRERAREKARRKTNPADRPWKIQHLEEVWWALQANCGKFLRRMSSAISTCQIQHCDAEIEWIVPSKIQHSHKRNVQICWPFWGRTQTLEIAAQHSFGTIAGENAALPRHPWRSEPLSACKENAEYPTLRGQYCTNTVGNIMWRQNLARQRLKKKKSEMFSVCPRIRILGLAECGL